jgi:UDP-N-acetylmuramoyl-L-alanyl-D-glutamate--2,6-diaminopimelate ligase
VERRIGGQALPAERTTPEAVDIQEDLARMVGAGDSAAVMEVSSHALELGRAAGITFAATAFTNLTQDHLDFHETLDSYFAAKSRLFLDPRFSRNRPPAVLNLDDEFGLLLAGRVEPGRLLTYSASGAEADLSARNIRSDGGGSHAELHLTGRARELPARGEGSTPASSRWHELHTPLVGGYNLANVLAALGLGLALGLDLGVMLESLGRFPGVPGRLERVERGQDFTVLVDYAHTPDSVQNVLEAVRAVSQGRIIALLGCGGDRDRGKRPLMGAAGERGSDLLVVTSDNPRSEDPEAIIGDIVAGLSRPEAALVEVDRRAAIRAALASAGKGDMVLLLGKGHERGQQFRSGTVPFDDREVAAEALEEILGKRT